MAPERSEIEMVDSGVHHVEAAGKSELVATA